jgi:hypothetical protein
MDVRHKPSIYHPYDTESVIFLIALYNILCLKAPAIFVYAIQLLNTTAVKAIRIFFHV